MQAERNAGRTVVAGKLYPDAVTPPCTFADGLATLNLDARHSEAEFCMDPSRPDGSKVYVAYPEAEGFSLDAAATLHLPAGGEWKVQSCADLFELRLKNDCDECGPAVRARASGRSTQAKRARRELREPCTHCFSGCPDVTYPAAAAPGAPPVTLPLESFCAHGRLPHVEALAALAQSHPDFPAYMCLCRTSNGSLGSSEAAASLGGSVYTGDGGNKEPGPLRGARVVVWFGCGFPSCADGTCTCPARCAVYQLVGESFWRVAFFGEHEHAVGACKCREVDCQRCFRAGRFPVPLPSGRGMRR
jgi:hypothetical protein